MTILGASVMTKGTCPLGAGTTIGGDPSRGNAVVSCSAQ